MNMRNIFTREEISYKEYLQRIKDGIIKTKDKKDWIESTYYQRKD